MRLVLRKPKELAVSCQVDGLRWTVMHGFQVFSTKHSLNFSSILQDDPEPDPTSKADLQTALNQESSRAVRGSWWWLGGCGRHEILGKHWGLAGLGSGTPWKRPDSFPSDGLIMLISWLIIPWRSHSYQLFWGFQVYEHGILIIHRFITIHGVIRMIKTPLEFFCCYIWIHVLMSCRPRGGVRECHADVEVFGVQKGMAASQILSDLDLPGHIWCVLDFWAEQHGTALKVMV